MAENKTLKNLNDENSEVEIKLTTAEADELLLGDVEVTTEVDVDEVLNDATEMELAGEAGLEEQRVAAEPDEIDPKSLPTSDRHGDFQFSGRRKVLNYGGESQRTKKIKIYRALEAAKANKRILEGVVAGSQMVNLPNDYKDALFEVTLTGAFAEGLEIDDVSVLIRGDNMTKIIQWDNREETKEKIIAMKDMFRNGMLHARIQFCIEDMVVLNPDEDDIAEREYSLVGNRIMANEILKEMYFDKSDPESIQPGDIVNGVILAIFANRVMYHVAGFDLFIRHRMVPYITGVRRLPDTISGRRLFTINEEKECMIANIKYDDETKEAVSLRTDFYEPLKGKLLRKVASISRGAMYSATVLRYTRGDDNKPVWLIAKTDSGVEVLCPPPNWQMPPKEMDSVKVKIVNVIANSDRALVVGQLKR